VPPDRQSGTELKRAAVVAGRLFGPAGAYDHRETQL